MRSGSGWRRPFYVLDQLATEHGLRPIPDRLVDALAAAAHNYMRLSATDLAAANTGDAAAVFGLTAGAVRLWSLTQDAVEDASWSSVLSFALFRHDNLGGFWTNAGRAREREQLERYRERLRLERDAAERENDV